MGHTRGISHSRTAREVQKVPHKIEKNIKSKKMKRYGQVIGVNPEKLEEYKKLHAAAWPGVLKMIKECNIQNYSIYYKDGLLFSYYEYIGED